MKPLKVIGQWIVFNGIRLRISSINTYQKYNLKIYIYCDGEGFVEELENEDQANYRLNELDIALTSHGNVDHD